jgi:DNA-binding NtrC family response regulator
MSLQLLPLRKRAGDIRLLISKFVGPDWSVEPEAQRALEAYDWPGNVRQLINALDRAQIMADDRIIRLENLPTEIAKSDSTDKNTLSECPIGDDLAAIQRAHIIEILNRENGNKARAARALGVNRRSFYRLLERHKIQIGDGGRDAIIEVATDHSR